MYCTCEYVNISIEAAESLARGRHFRSEKTAMHEAKHLAPNQPFRASEHIQLYIEQNLRLATCEPLEKDLQINHNDNDESRLL